MQKQIIITIIAGLSMSVCLIISPVLATDAIDELVATYEHHIAGRQGNMLIWKDGSQMKIDDGLEKSHQQRLKHADIEDMMRQAYPVGKCSYARPARNFDPGRVRNDTFFRKIYGNSARQVKSHLVTVKWFGRRLRVTSINNVDEQLRKVAADLAKLPRKLRKYLAPSAGTFNWRKIAGTRRLSVHSFGAAIDINTKYADYWRWSGGKPGNVPAYHNKIPVAIIEAFEDHGFIWGGKWYHYDTMHFEYRPELLRPATAGNCGNQS